MRPVAQRADRLLWPQLTPCPLRIVLAMNSIVLGAGRVGESVAESRVSEKNDIAAIDTNAA